MKPELHFSKECGAWVGRADDPKVSAFVRPDVVRGRPAFVWGVRRPELGWGGIRGGSAFRLDDAIGFATDAWHQLQAQPLP